MTESTAPEQSTPPEPMAACPDRRWFYVAIVGLALLLGGIVADELHQISKNRLGAFRTYYAAARAMREGRNPYGRSAGYPYVYPPLYGFVCEPLARLTQATAARVMLGVNGAVLLVSLLVAARAALLRLGQSPPARSSVAWIALAAALISAAPIDRELRVLQTNGVLLLGFVLALHWMDRRPVWAGLALAAASSIKYVPLLALPYLLLRRRWAVAGATVAWVTGLALLPAVSLGWSTNVRYLAAAHGGLSRLVGETPTSGSAKVHGLADPLNISVTSAAVRLAALWGLPERAGLAMMLVVFVGWVGGLAMIYRHHQVPVFHWPSAAGQRVMPYSRLLLLEWAGVMTAAMVFSPNAELILAVPLAAILAAVIGTPGLYEWSSLSSPLSRGSTLVGATVLVVALLFPVAALGRRFTVEWNAAGAACWCMLGVYALLCWWMSQVESARVAGNS